MSANVLLGGGILAVVGLATKVEIASEHRALLAGGFLRDPFPLGSSAKVVVLQNAFKSKQAFLVRGIAEN